MGQEDTDCIFCRIIKGDIPCAKIYEDSEVLSFLDIAPVNPGHALVIPKRHYENIYSIPESELSNVIKAAKKIAIAVKKAADADGIVISQSNEKAAGQVVPHMHFHIIPRLKDDGLKLFPQKKYSEGEMELIAGKIRNLL